MKETLKNVDELYDKINQLLKSYDLLKKNKLSLDDKFVVSENAWRLSQSGYSSMFIMVNDEVSVEDLLKGIIIASGNDACVALAEGIAGSEENFAEMMNEIKKVVPNAKLVYNNSPSFNWTLNFRQQVFEAWEQEGKDVTQYEKDDLMAEKYDSTELAIEADEKIRTFQADAAKEAGIFHHLITLPTYHTAALSTDNLAKAYFGDDGMLG